MKKFDGLVIVEGRTFGPLLKGNLNLEERKKGSKDEEWALFREKKEALLTELEERSQDESLDEETRLIFEAHQMMADDPEFLQEIKGLIDDGKPYEEAVLETAEQFSEMMKAIDDEYMQARSSDILDIAHQLLGSEDLDVDGKILLKDEIFPSDVLDYSKNGVKGFLSLKGSATSHASILAKNTGIPYITNLPEEVMNLEGEVFLDDALYIDLSEEDRRAFMEKVSKDQAEEKELEALIHVETVTPQGKKIKVSTNISSLEDVQLALKHGAEGVALFRTEFLFMKPSLPSRQEQKRVYEDIAQALEGRSLVIRTMDLGGDKVNPELQTGSEDNPFLGLRGVRLSLERKTIFKKQLKALLETAVNYNIQVMFPMVTKLEDVLEVKRLIKDCESELKEEGTNFKRPPLGVMIEVPTAVFIMKELSEEVDFVSFGTNDLLQYMAASDRMNDKVSPWYDPYQPGFLRAIKKACDDRSNLHLGMCGDLAADKLLAPFWAALGFEELGVPAASILPIKKILLEKNISDEKEWIQYVLSAKTSEELKRRLSC